MSTSFRSAAAAAAILSVATLPVSAAEPGWYFGGEAGGSFLDDADNSLEVDPDFDQGSPGTPGSCVILIPGLICVLPTPGTPGSPGNLTPGEQQDFDTSYDDGYLGGLTLGYLFPSGLRTELELRYAENDIEENTAPGMAGSSGEGDIGSTALMGNMWYDFNRDGGWHPYIGGGIGAAQLELDTGGDFKADDTVFAYQGGAGINFDLSERTVLDLGYRYFATDDPEYSDSGVNIDGEYEQQVAMLSLRYTFAPSERADSDGDGVPDIHDKCPNTPKGAPVDSEGCALDSDGDGVADYLDKCPGTPEGVPVDEDGCPLDSDGDGVPDYKDDCPNTPKGTQVNDKGCPLVVDSDGDGVPDDQDLCPDTPPGQPVLTNGCAVGQSAVLQGVNFEFDSAKLTSGARDILRETAQTLKDSPGFVVEVAGHTDSLGSDSYNKDLSQRRADSVKDFLVAEGVEAARLKTMGYGESQPIAPNTNPDGSDNPEGRAENRRVELSVVEEQQ